MERWMETMRSYYNADAKRVYYLSLEFLIGRILGNGLLNMGIYDGGGCRYCRSRGWDWRGRRFGRAYTCRIPDR